MTWIDACRQYPFRLQAHRMVIRFRNTIEAFNTYVVLLAAFVFMVVPMGLLLRLTPWDPLRLRRNQPSLKQFSKKPFERHTLRNPY